MPYPSFREVDQEGNIWFMSAFPHLGEYYGLTISCRDEKGSVWSKAWTDEEVKELKDGHVKDFGWPSFWRALCNAFGPKDPPHTVASMGGRRRLDIPLKS